MYEISPLKSMNYAITGNEAILQNARFLLATIKNSCPMAREDGWEPPLDYPSEYAQTSYAAQVVELLEQNIQEIKVEEVTFEQDDITGKIIPRVKVVIVNDS